MNALFFFFGSTIFAFEVQFYDGDHCTGNQVGLLTTNIGSPAGCQTQFNSPVQVNKPINVPGDAFNVLATPDTSGYEDVGAAVAFYSNPDCTLLIGLTNVPACVGVGAYSSFKVIELTDAWVGEHNLQPNQIITWSPNATATFKSEALTETTSAPSMQTATSGRMRRARGPVEDKNMVTRAAEHMVSGGRISHGAVRRTNNGIFRFHQVAKRVWKGVSLDEWNDAIHKRNTGVLRADGWTKRNTKSILERDIPATTCNMVRSCLIEASEDTGFKINDVGAQLIDTLKILDPSGNFWEYLESGLIIEIVDDKGQAMGFLYAQTDLHNEKIQTCSSQGTELDAFQAALAMGVDGTVATDMRVDVKLLSGTGVTDSLFVSTRSAALPDQHIHPVCEAVEVNF